MIHVEGLVRLGQVLKLNPFLFQIRSRFVGYRFDLMCFVYVSFWILYSMSQPDLNSILDLNSISCIFLYWHRLSFFSTVAILFIIPALPRNRFIFSDAIYVSFSQGNTKVASHPFSVVSYSTVVEIVFICSYALFVCCLFFPCLSPPHPSPKP